jgi:hypothetical protein
MASRGSCGSLGLAGANSLAVFRAEFWFDGATEMEQIDSVTVYSFTIVDLHQLDAQAMRLSSYKATRESIRARRGAEVLEGTGQKVSRAELDEEGRYRRMATGWGELA